jgi:hypothetical protein
MCCAIKMAGVSAGIGTSKSLIASVPPVDAPTIINFSEVGMRGRLCGVALTARVSMRAPSREF